jgi:imidazolonepropionase-like amidohydrolase
MAMGQGSIMGRIAPGLAANLAVLERDPTADIANLRSVLFTVKRGHRLDRTEYRPIRPGEMGDDDD